MHNMETVEQLYHLKQELQETLKRATETSSDTNNEIRRAAFDAFDIKGFPTKKDEEYKYTPVSNFLKRSIDRLGLPSEDIEIDRESIFYKEEGHHLIFINGNYNEHLSEIVTDDAIEFRKSIDLNELNKIAGIDADPFVALNTSLLSSALIVDVKKNRKALPVFIYQLINNTDQLLLNSRILINGEVSSESVFVEKTITLGKENCLINKITEVDVRENASVNYTILQDNESHLLEINGLKSRQFKDSRFYANTYSFKGGMIRNNLNLQQDEEHCETHMHGLYLLNGNSHVDNHTSIDHRKPNSYSNELYKGILDENSHGVFNGKIYVRQNAQQTNAFQSNNNINLSDTATVNTKPQLEIWADDVKCSHGCTVGQLDEEALFYLRTRGLSRRSAIAMMLTAFAEESFEYLPFDFIKEELHRKINNRLGV